MKIIHVHAQTNKNVSTLLAAFEITPLKSTIRGVHPIKRKMATNQSALASNMVQESYSHHSVSGTAI